MDFSRHLMSLVLLAFVLATFFSTALTRHRVRHHRDRFKRQQGAHLFLPGSHVLSGGDGEQEAGPWDGWGAPSACSRSCGGGVATQTRRCRHPQPGACRGPDRKHFSCNTQDCPDDGDYRAQQCSEFDGTPFEGVYYKWIPYTKAPNQCELNCMPRGERFYYRHKKQVEDGTRCNAESLDVCVDGTCQPVGCDMMLGSEAREDKCRQCGGNGTTCQTLNGLLDMQDLQVGYNDILLIPAGATNIDVREVQPSNNYLAIRNATGHYYLNGNWRIDFPKTLRFAGCNFHYDRSPQGFAAPDTITCLGPTYEPLFIVLLYQDVNVGVRYEYSIPKAISADPETYAWTFDEFTPCSVTCGGGLQSRNVSCAGRRTLEPVEKTLCDTSTEPASTQTCGEQPCEPQWVPSDWGPCSEVCGEDGVQSREIKCERLISQGVSSVVSDQFCEQRFGPKENTLQECNRDVPCPMWHVGPWKPCDHLCGKGKETRQVLCFRKVDGKIEVLEDSMCEAKEKRPETEKSCNLRPCEGVDWVTSEWSGCDKCGLDSETRKVHCATEKGEVYPDDLCQGEQKPDLVRQCETSKLCETQWYASQWSECSANCGIGVQTRNVFCGTFEGDSLRKLEDSACNDSKKYDSLKNCSAELEVCAGEWFSGPWSKCDKECGAGTMTRKVICMQEEKVIAATNCDANSIPFSSETCNAEPCGDDEVLPVNTTKPVEEKESAEDLTPSEFQPDSDVEEVDIDEDECEEWGYEDDKKLERVEDFTTTDSDYSTESTWLTDDLTLSDATGVTDDTKETSEFTDEGSGDFTSPIDGSSTSSDFSSASPDGSTVPSGSTDSSSDLTTVEGSGESTIFETTESGATGETTSASDLTTVETSTDSDTGATTGETEEESTDGTTEISAGTEASPANTVTSDTSDVTTDDSTDVSSGTTDSVSGVTTEDTSEVTSDSSAQTDTSDVTEDSSAQTSDTTQSSIADTSSSSDGTTDSTSPSSIDTEETETTDSSTPTSEETSPSSESTSETTPISTESSESTESSLSTVESSDVTTEASSDLTTAASSDGTTEEEEPNLGPDIGESDAFAAHLKDTSESPDPDVTTLEVMTDSSAAEETTVSSSDFTTSSDLSSDITTSTDLSSDVTTSSDLSSDVTTSSDLTTASSDLTTTSSDVSTVSGLSTESEPSGATDDTTVSGLTEATSESEGTTEAVSTSSDLSTESDVTTESGPTETTEFESTSESGSTESTMIDIWTTTESGLSSETAVSGWGTTPYTIESVTQRKRICKRKKKKPSCKTTPFGCCYDLVTPAQGPFDKGCPTPKTCNETKFGCCEDGVSPATGPKFEGCPKSLCTESLFGCCPDNKTAAEGNDFLGCKKEPPPPECLSSKFGCCEDNTTAATGPEGAGCNECEKSEFGCCPDGVQPATGKDLAGCELEVTTEIVVDEDCANSTFGCCPDGQMVATGEHFQGCGIINKDNCTLSYFGCCPDGVSAALGPEYQGCRMACEDDPHGCCPDRVTAAHGPNQEGCCLSHPWGCCPDNILPARGPALEGCGCQYSPYGCCPDNTTAARGYGNEGCGCQHTEHGCCPDRYTPAAGPDNQGCACHTFQFGCCPDGVSAAKGPHKQGCGCRNTEFGCCSDDQTPAQGPNNEGCDCSSSKFGCCPDGVTDAQDDNFEGCQDIPDNRQESCVLDKDRGSCRNYTVKWFFDMQYGGCSRFWYGGCDGNANRFMSLDECKSTCVEPQGKEVCQLPKVTGACEGYYPSWYYDKDRKQCAQFIWGGCLGNANRFETREECQSLCAVDKDQDACEQPQEVGPCNGAYRRWFFNKESNSCEQFAYGGCKANNNNFPTEMACKQQCLQPGRKKDLCALPRAQGNCTQRESRWYFDASENRCMPFYYSGCDGNSNRFVSRQACEADCPTDVERDICTLPALVGECHNYTDRWYYDTNAKRCQQFYYGGCGGNENSFPNEQACQQRCEQPVTPAPLDQKDFQREHCFLPSEQGPCRSSQPRWFYDSRDGVCKQFLYGGCQGNANNFETREDCHQRCGAVQDLCVLPMVVGPCDSDNLQWFYDNNTDTCQEFNYGGCQGNDNRFSDQQSCEQRCKKSPATAVVTEAPRVPEPQSPEEHYRTAAPEVHICYTPVDVGNCSENHPAWYYDAASQKCQAFVFTGCGGNANRFVSEEQCERHCGRFRGLDVCAHPKDTGNCKAAVNKWYYDRDSGRCEEFTYGGCGGSGNRFSFVHECESVCVKLVEPPQTNDTGVSHVAVCRLPVEVGPCEGRYNQLRWHFDEDRNGCVSFIYSGCGGNQNNFKSHKACSDFCTELIRGQQPENEVDVDEPPGSNPCDVYKDECTRCPYGTEGYVDAELCNRCRCYDPCRDTSCPDQYVCTIDLNPRAMLHNETQFIAACRPMHKEGECPELRGEGTRDCDQECRNDADCSGELKCCPSNCGNTCAVPVAPQRPAELLTTVEPAFTQPPIIVNRDAPYIYDDDVDTDLAEEEGSYVTLSCQVHGNPHPTITWHKGNTVVNGSLPRHRLLADGSLQIVGLTRQDAGTYFCVADNGVGTPARKDIDLVVTEPVSEHSAGVVGDEDTRYTVILGAPFTLRCYAMGWPRPVVTWWRGNNMLPMSSESYAQNRDYSLLVRAVRLSNLGVYTCQAYNGIGKAASWSLTLQAFGPVLSTQPEDEEFKKYLVPVPSQPASPYRPSRPPPRPPAPRPALPTPQPHIPEPYTEPNPDIVPAIVPEAPRVYVVAVKTTISMGRTTFPVGSDISIPCDVEGHPKPQVHWYKNGELIEPSDSIQISESHRLTISRATSNDSGEYSCVAANEYSKSSSSAVIGVEGIFIHPNCTDSPFFANCKLIVEARYCTHKYYATFCCKSCTEAGQLPSYGPHLGIDSSQSNRSPNQLNKK